MKGKCPSCGKIDDYEAFDKTGAVCKNCNRAVKMIQVIEKKEKEKIKWQ